MVSLLRNTSKGDFMSGSQPLPPIHAREEREAQLRRLETALHGCDLASIRTLEATEHAIKTAKIMNYDFGTPAMPPVPSTNLPQAPASPRRR